MADEGAVPPPLQENGSELAPAPDPTTVVGVGVEVGVGVGAVVNLDASDSLKPVVDTSLPKLPPPPVPSASSNPRADPGPSGCASATAAVTGSSEGAVSSAPSSTAAGSDSVETVVGASAGVDVGVGASAGAGGSAGGSVSETPSGSPAPSAAGTPRASRKRYAPEDLWFGAVLGEGSFARVMYGCLKEDQRKEFAIKVMEKRFIKKEDKVQFVMMERNIMSVVNHRHIVRLMFTFQDETYLFMAMQLCKGGELRKTIRHFVEENRTKGIDNCACPVDLARDYTRQIVSALEYLHFTMQVVHRDLKPENILLDHRGSLKVTDFGTAKDEKVKDKSQDAFVGTAEYVSPEVLRDEEAHRSADYWALGCIVYQMFVGRPPFHGESEYLTFQEVLSYPTSHSLEFPEHFPDDARDLVLRLLDPDPVTRLGAGPDDSDYSFDALKNHPFLTQDPPPEYKRYVPPLYQPDPRYLSDGGGARWELMDDVQELPREASVRRLEIARRASVGLLLPSAPAACPATRVPPSGTYWLAEIAEGEAPILWGEILKKKGLFTKRRDLVLTNKPRLVYFDAKTQVKKGEIPWGPTLRVHIKSTATFDVFTEHRIYHLTDVAGDALKWQKAIHALAIGKRA